MTVLMEAIVLAGGYGKRIRHILPEIPKPMAPVAGRPFLEIVLDNLACMGFTNIILSLGYKAEMIQSHFGNNFSGMKLFYEIEDRPSGTGGAIRASMKHCLSDCVFIFNGDTYIDLEIKDLEALWQKVKEPIIVGREVLDTSRYGRIETREGKIIRFDEKSITGRGYINAGCYVFPKNLLDHFSKGKAFSIESDFLSSAVKKQIFWLFITKGKFIDIGTPEDYKKAQNIFR